MMCFQLKYNKKIKKNKWFCNCLQTKKIKKVTFKFKLHLSKDAKL